MMLPAALKSCRWSNGLVCLLLILSACSQDATDPSKWEEMTTESKADTLRLSDGSLVTLQRDSRLRYPAKFPRQERRVELQGEGFFEITNNDKPFVVTTANEMVQGKGGNYLVKEMPVQSNTVVYVDQGEFTLKGVDSTAVITLASGQGGVSDYRQGIIATAPAANANLTAWKTGVLVFQDQSLRNALRAIQSNFGYSFKLQQPALANCNISGRFELSDPQTSAQAMFAPLGATCKLVGSSLFEVTGGGCPDYTPPGH